VLGGVALLLLLGYAFSWVFAFIGLASSSPEASNAYGFIVILPLTFASSVFVPVDSMPGWLQAFAAVNPVTTMADATRALFIRTPAGNDVWERSPGGSVSRPSSRCSPCGATAVRSRAERTILRLAAAAAGSR